VVPFVGFPPLEVGTAIALLAPVVNDLWWKKSGILADA
jgi:hypothetical protein